MSEGRSWRRGWTRFGGIFDLERKRSRIEQIERDSTAPDFWNDNVKAQATLKEKSTLEGQVGAFDKAIRELDDAAVLAELAAEEKDSSSATEAENQLVAVEG